MSLESTPDLSAMVGKDFTHPDHPGMFFRPMSLNRIRFKGIADPVPCFRVAGWHWYAGKKRTVHLRHITCADFLKHHKPENPE